MRFVFWEAFKRTPSYSENVLCEVKLSAGLGAKKAASLIICDGFIQNSWAIYDLQKIFNAEIFR